MAIWEDILSIAKEKKPMEIEDILNDIEIALEGLKYDLDQMNGQVALIEGFVDDLNRKIKEVADEAAE